MKSAYEAYRERVSAEEEDRLVDEACQETLLKYKAPALPVCSGQEGVLFKPNAPSSNAGLFKGTTREMPFRCWQTLATLNYGQASPPSSFVGDSAAEAQANDPVYKCREAARARIQIERAVVPDARFWIGAGAAGVGVLLAVATYAFKRR